MLDDKLRGTLGSVLLANHHLDDQIKNEIGGARSMYGESKIANRVLVGNLRGRDHLEGLTVNG